MLNKNCSSSFICGGLSAMTNIIIVFPLYKTTFFQQLHGMTFANAIRQMYREKLPNLYRGVLPPLLQKTVSLSIMFGAYDEAERHLVMDEEQTNRFGRAFSGIFAGTMEATLVPFERVQTLLQNQHSQIRYKNTFHAFQGILFQGHGGISELYRGFMPCLLRNCIGNATYFVLREEIFQLLPVSSSSSSLSNNNLQTSSSSPLSIFSSSSDNNLIGIKRLLRDFLTGAMLGAMIGALTFPFNVAKTQMQSKLSGNSIHKIGWIATLSNIYRDRGFSYKAIYRGLPANSLRSMLSWGVITMSYDFYMSYLFKA